MPASSTSYRVNVQLRFPPDLSGEPLVCRLPRLYDVDFAILRAQITPRQEGFLTLALLGTPEACTSGIEFLRSHDVQVTPVAQRIWHDETRCMQCGMCTSLCPTAALLMDSKTRLLVFAKEQCTACGRCTRVCPVRALQMDVVDSGVLSE